MLKGLPSSGDRIRTCDLRVMSPTSYHCSTPQYIFKAFYFVFSRTMQYQIFSRFAGAKIQHFLSLTNYDLAN